LKGDSLEVETKMTLDRGPAVRHPRRAPAPQILSTLFLARRLRAAAWFPIVMAGTDKYGIDTQTKVDALMSLAREFVQDDCPLQAIKCYEAICNKSCMNALPLPEARARVQLSYLLLEFTDNVHRAKTHLETTVRIPSSAIHLHRLTRQATSRVNRILAERIFWAPPVRSLSRLHCLPFNLGFSDADIRQADDDAPLRTHPPPHTSTTACVRPA
jgi:hypothetical protein